MSALATWQEAWAAFGVPALEVSLVAGLAALLARLVGSVFWRRTVWQVCLLGVFALTLLEFSGGTPGLARRVFGKSVRSDINSANATSGEAARLPSPEPSQPPAETGLAVSAAEPPALTLHRLNRRTESPASSMSAADARPRRNWSRFLDRCALLWLLGTTGVLAIIVVSRLRFRLLRRGCTELNDASLRERAASLARKLGLRRRVRLLEARQFSGPVAFGVMRPAIGLPPTFKRDHAPEQQNAMLAHELAHLVSNDPAWYLLADVTAALLWWHPLVWWARRRLRAASEAAADEASLLVPRGPEILAECLVQLGARLRSPQPSGWLGIEGSGFRSGLARRVERLLNLRTPSWRPPGRLTSVAARTLGPLTLVLAVVLCTAWTIPESSNHGEAMKTTVWKRSLTALALIPMLGAEPNPALAAEPLPPPPPAKAAVKASTLKAKLEAITLNEVAYDNLPLGVVVDHLIKEAASRDPEKVGINFLFAQSAEPPPSTIDPATGLPVVGFASEIDLAATTIRIVPPLKKVRLVDVLDAIVRVADRPIKYSVEDYAVVFTTDPSRAVFASSPAAPATATVLRTYKLDYRVLANSVQNMLGYHVQPGSAVAAELRETILPRFGIKLGGSSADVFYNEASGTLLIRATPENQAAVQAVIETLGGGTPAAGGVSTARPQMTPTGGGGSGGGGTADGSVSIARPTTASDDKPFVVYVGKTAPYFRIGDEPMTFPQLQQALAETVKKRPDVRLAIKADKGAPFDRLMKLIEAAQQARISSVGLVTEEQSAP